MGNSLCLYGCVLYHREKTGDPFGYAQGRLFDFIRQKGRQTWLRMTFLSATDLHLPGQPLLSNVMRAVREYILST